MVDSGLSSSNINLHIEGTFAGSRTLTASLSPPFVFQVSVIGVIKPLTYSKALNLPLVDGRCESGRGLRLSNEREALRLRSMKSDSIAV